MENKLTFEKVLNGEINLVYTLNDELSRQYYHRHDRKLTRGNLRGIMQKMNDFYKRKDKDAKVKEFLSYFVDAFAYVRNEENKDALDNRLLACNKLIVELLDFEHSHESYEHNHLKKDAFSRFFSETYELFDPEYIATEKKLKNQIKDGVSPDVLLQDFLKNPNFPEFGGNSGQYSVLELYPKSSTRQFAEDNQVSVDGALAVLFGDESLHVAQALYSEEDRLDNEYYDVALLILEHKRLEYLYRRADRIQAYEAKFDELHVASDNASDAIKHFQDLDYEDRKIQALTHMKISQFAEQHDLEFNAASDVIWGKISLGMAQTLAREENRLYNELTRLNLAVETYWEGNYGYDTLMKIFGYEYTPEQLISAYDKARDEWESYKMLDDAGKEAQALASEGIGNVAFMNDIDFATAADMLSERISLNTGLLFIKNKIVEDQSLIDRINEQEDELEMDY
jgi:hypothetical protein